MMSTATPHECLICGETYPSSARCYGWSVAHPPVEMVPVGSR